MKKPMLISCTLNRLRGTNKFYIPVRHIPVEGSGRLFVNGRLEASTIRFKNGKRLMMSGSIPKKGDVITIYYEREE